jgi:L-lactate dehydrogenase complex protein LldE
MAEPKRLSLFATCLVDSLYPRVGQAVVETLERLGCQVGYPEGQTCCGLPFYNNGFVDEARALAERTIDAMAGEETVVVPSGSCAWMMREIYPTLSERGAKLSSRVREYSEVLDELPGFRAKTGAEGAPRKLTYHPSCHLTRGLGVDAPPRRALARIEGTTLCPLKGETQCCGFGGTFSVRYPEISTAMLEDKLADAAKTGAELLVVTDVGCLMQLEGGLKRKEAATRVVHLSELLAEGTLEPEKKV